MNGSPCKTEGGFDGEIKATADVAICCANHDCGTNLPVSSAPVGGWYQHSGKYSITNHGVQPCTFFEAKNVKPGKYKFCCTKCWGSGVFFGAGDNTPPAIDKYTVKTASATPCSEVKNTRGGQYGSCMERGAKIGTPLWSNRNYAWKGGPKDLLDGTWTYNKVHLDGGPCAREGGFEGKVTVPSVAAICCANHCGRTNVPSGGETWSKHPGVFSITNHGGTPCTFYETTLKPNKQCASLLPDSSPPAHIPYDLLRTGCWCKKNPGDAANAQNGLILLAGTSSAARHAGPLASCSSTRRRERSDTQRWLRNAPTYRRRTQKSLPWRREQSLKNRMHRET